MDDLFTAQALETWRINNAANQLLLDGITADGFKDTMSTRGGRTVALQFAHLHNVRLAWLEAVGKEWLKNQKKIDSRRRVDRGMLKQRLKESEVAIGRLIAQALEDGGRVKGFKRGVLPMLGYMIAHDAHHRGNILLTLKLSGHTVTTKVQYGIWEWGKL